MKMAGAVLRGVVLVIMPTLPLQANQVAQMDGIRNSYTIDLDRIGKVAEAEKIKEKLLGLGDIAAQKRPTVYIFASPQCITPKHSRHGKAWSILIFESLARRGILRLIV